MQTKNKLVDPRVGVESDGASPELSALGAEFPARAEFPPWTPESPSPPSQDQLIHQHDEAEPDAYDQDSQFQSRRGQELRLLSSGFQLLLYEAHTRRLRKCASAEDAVYALISLQGQVQLKSFPLKFVGQYYANLVGSHGVHEVHR